MEKQEFIDFARENPACFMATCDGDQPHVRTLILFFADETGFYFGTLSPKEMCQQLHKNPKVEICFYNHPTELAKAKQMRVTGEVEFVDDPALKHRLHEERLMLDEIAGKNLEPYFEIVRVSAGDMHFWTMMDASHEAELEHLVF
ncbi:pyridoxamine 5'-phosphate oxidase family protein [Maribellus mangrovi]|uniref:pyridoxamine 5'-phosphate oxidase family protein n=1 Tax=Maribellus mangrovi TaxID=3133146 RepID=UPI0030EBB5AC